MWEPSMSRSVWLVQGSFLQVSLSWGLSAWAPRQGLRVGHAEARLQRALRGMPNDLNCIW